MTALATAVLPKQGNFLLAQRFQSSRPTSTARSSRCSTFSRLSHWRTLIARREVRYLANRLAKATPELLNEMDRDRLVEEVLDEVFGLGPLEGLMNDPTISDILVNGPKTIFVERALRPPRADQPAVRRQRTPDAGHPRIAARVGRQPDEMSPMVDARLPTARVNAIVPPLALDGPALSIRRFGVPLRPGGPARQATHAAGNGLIASGRSRPASTC